MEDERVISFERGKQLADQLGVEFFETSAKENINVKVCIFLLFYVYCNFIAFSGTVCCMLSHIHKGSVLL